MRSGGRGPEMIADRSDRHGSSRPTMSGWNVPMMASRWSLRDPGQERDQGAGGGIGAVEVLEDEHHGTILAQPSEQAEDPLHRPCLAALRGGHARGRGPSRSVVARRSPRSGSRRTTSDGADPRRAASVVGRQGPQGGPIARTMGPYGSSAPSGHAVARRTAIGSAHEPPSAPWPRR